MENKNKIENNFIQKNLSEELIVKEDVAENTLSPEDFEENLKTKGVELYEESDSIETVSQLILEKVKSNESETKDALDRLKKGEEGGYSGGRNGGEPDTSSLAKSIFIDF